MPILQTVQVRMTVRPKKQMMQLLQMMKNSQMYLRRIRTLKVDIHRMRKRRMNMS